MNDVNDLPMEEFSAFDVIRNSTNLRNSEKNKKRLEIFYTKPSVNTKTGKAFSAGLTWEEEQGQEKTRDDIVKDKKYFNEPLIEDNVPFVETLNKIQTSHNLNIDEICNQLKCRRTWVNKHIVSKVDKITITPYWNIILRRQEFVDTDDTTFLNREKYNEFLDSSVQAIKRKTILLSNELIMDNVQEYMDNVKKIDKEIEEIKFWLSINNYRQSIARIKNLNVRKKEIWDKSLNSLGKKIAIDLPKIKDLTKIEAIDITKEEIRKYKSFNFYVSQDLMKNYGDDDNNIKRKFFKMGFATIEFNFDDETRKLYYQPEGKDINIIDDKNEMKKRWLCKYKLYRDNEEEILNRMQALGHEAY